MKSFLVIKVKFLKFSKMRGFNISIHEMISKELILTPGFILPIGTTIIINETSYIISKILYDVDNNSIYYYSDNERELFNTKEDLEKYIDKYNWKFFDHENS